MSKAILSNNIIDLKGSSYNDFGSYNLKISLYPNPANKVLYATVYLPLSLLKERKACKLHLTLFSQIGNKIATYEVLPAETISIPIDGLTDGAYFIRADEEISIYGVEPLKAVIEPVIIQK